MLISIIKRIGIFVLSFAGIIGFWLVIFHGMAKEAERGHYVADPDYGYTWQDPNV